MKKQDTRFQEIKVQMVMKLKKLGRRAAIAEIARMDAARHKAAEEEAAREAAERARMAEAREELRRRHRRSANISRSGDEEFMTAEEFFGES